MEVVILCGGKGTRLSEYTQAIPKPMIEIGSKPILLHLMQYYASLGHKDFILCLGYKADRIEEYFRKVNLKGLNVQTVDTGENSNKAERLLKVKDKIKGSSFLVSYGDDVSDVDINEVIKFHNKNKKVVTLIAVPLVSQFGIIELNKKNEVTSFKEKPKLAHFMNGGFYVMDKKIFNYIKKGFDLEKETFEGLARQRQIAAFKHEGFWKSMNTLKDVIELNELYGNGSAPWLKWTGKE
ncbi:glucose-1-phosphate cytidylyltransferase [Candidatus Woesearchaeota archaeon]|nr:glucose-1-phosphate cytidylyltransferase [Candidatus Woesearchaeota archaeon]